MSDEKYICPRCGNEMSWTGNISQDLSEKRYCAVVFEYECRNFKCLYKSKYNQLDSAGMRHKNMIDMGRVL